jgi:hypothetical protein
MWLRARHEKGGGIITAVKVASELRLGRVRVKAGRVTINASALNYLSLRGVHIERSEIRRMDDEAIPSFEIASASPRNDEHFICHCERNEAIPLRFFVPPQAGRKMTLKQHGQRVGDEQ